MSGQADGVGTIHNASKRKNLRTMTAASTPPVCSFTLLDRRTDWWIVNHLQDHRQQGHDVVAATSLQHRLKTAVMYHALRHSIDNCTNRWLQLRTPSIITIAAIIDSPANPSALCTVWFIKQQYRTQRLAAYIAGLWWWYLQTSSAANCWYQQVANSFNCSRYHWQRMMTLNQCRIRIEDRIECHDNQSLPVTSVAQPSFNNTFKIKLFRPTLLQ